MGLADSPKVGARGPKVGARGPKVGARGPKVGARGPIVGAFCTAAMAGRAVAMTCGAGTKGEGHGEAG